MIEFGILNFLNSVKELQRRGELKKWDPWIITVHAIHESDSFRRVIGNHNYWGIKTPRRWHGKVVKVKTHEYKLSPPKHGPYKVVKGRNGKIYYRIPVIARFVDFDSLEEALIFYEDLVKHVYKTAYRYRDNYKVYFPELVRGPVRWATDPKYAQKLVRLYDHIVDKYGYLSLEVG